MSNKGVKTTIAAFILLAVGIALFAALVMDQIDKSEFAIAMSTLAAFGATIIGFLAKDQNASHTKK